ncbi:hypothetical protein VTN96DRAFT_934 [Rasamsonia emersonii]|uniref:Integral membrane protein n=1 Tax=Rasamsonia emersonii (strain ATCC 16479 / CBS 393.64 / IMI 116815) TaxID=1408163 RepID=A0A0F4YMU0_RASE3|nr:Integral membrane protein [Rasamsonia emersonii CBS 393.64]KKA19141.1 Integral membrane protein [Rasamsonia emersonii CBS 393.64]
MPIVSRLLSVVLRIGEIGFGAIVAGIVGYYLNQLDGSGWPEGRWIYTEVIAALSILLGLFWLIPFASTFFVWPVDVVLALAWFAAFGILVDELNGLPCGTIWDWGYINDYNDCSRWRAAEAFSFLSAITWLISGLLGLYFVWRVDVAARRRGYWYGRYDV